LQARHRVRCIAAEFSLILNRIFHSSYWWRIDLPSMPQRPVSPLQAAKVARLPNRTVRPTSLAVPDLRAALLWQGRAVVLCLLRSLQDVRQFGPSPHFPRPRLRGLVGQGLPPAGLPRLSLRPLPLSLFYVSAPAANHSSPFRARSPRACRAAFLSSGLIARRARAALAAEEGYIISRCLTASPVPSY